MTDVAAATTMPILMLGGDPGADAGATFRRWSRPCASPMSAGSWPDARCSTRTRATPTRGRAPRGRHRPRRSVMTWFHPAGTLRTDQADVLVTPDLAPWTYSGLRVVTLSPGTTVELTLEAGRGRARPPVGAGRERDGGRGDRSILAGREGVFAAVSDWVYIPLGAVLTIAGSGGEVALCTARATVRHPFRHVRGRGRPGRGARCRAIHAADHQRRHPGVLRRRRPDQRVRGDHPRRELVVVAAAPP